MDNDAIKIVIDIDLKDLIPAFLDNRIKDVELSKKALQEQDFDALRIIGHSMKGVGGGYGFDKITEIGDEMERAALKGDSEVVQQQLALLVDYLDRIEVVFE